MLTEKLALAFGIYMIAGGIAIATRPTMAKVVIGEFRDSPALTYLAGAFVFIFGAGLLMVHHDWSGLLPGFITLVAIVAVIEGLILIAAPNVLLSFAEMLAPNTIASHMFGFFTLCLGLALTIASGFPTGFV